MKEQDIQHDLVFDPNDPPEHVRKWMTRAKRCMKAMPKGLMLFANGDIAVVVLNKDGSRPMRGTSLDQAAAISGNLGKCEGGDW